MNPTYDFSGQVALVTGASSGMGLVTAQAYAESGAAVVLTDSARIGRGKSHRVRGRKYRRADCLGFYHAARRDVRRRSHHLRLLRPATDLPPRRASHRSRRERLRGPAWLTSAISIANRAPGDITMLYRAATDRDVAFRSELLRMAEARGVRLHFLIGTAVGDDSTDQLGVPALQALVPDIADLSWSRCPAGRREGVPKGQTRPATTAGLPASAAPRL